MSDLPDSPEPQSHSSAVESLVPAVLSRPDWQHLPPRGARLAAFGNAMGFAIPSVLSSGVLSRLADFGTPWLIAPVAGVLGAAFGAWLGVKRHRRTLWKLDAEGFALQRGRWWQTETRVPVSRVQHLDLKRGPLERAFKLATLVIHTAGTKMAAVSVSGLDGEDAERLRDRLARQLDHDDDAL
ncbi:MAG: PH domain-containing protein [Pseudoxanthomonas sp.]